MNNTSKIKVTMGGKGVVMCVCGKTPTPREHISYSATQWAHKMINRLHDCGSKG